MTIKPGEFIRRFLIHVLPNGFHRIRHYGLLASGVVRGDPTPVAIIDKLNSRDRQPFGFGHPNPTAIRPLTNR
jgi:hypothetical protein